MCHKWKTIQVVVDLLSHAFSDVKIPGVLIIQKKKTFCVTSLKMGPGIIEGEINLNSDLSWEQYINIYKPITRLRFFIASLYDLPG